MKLSRRQEKRWYAKERCEFTPPQPDVMTILKKLKERMSGRRADDGLYNYLDYH
jgi:hypothetical protein